MVFFASLHRRLDVNEFTLGMQVICQL